MIQYRNFSGYTLVHMILHTQIYKHTYNTLFHIVPRLKILALYLHSLMCLYSVCTNNSTFHSEVHSIQLRLFITHSHFMYGSKPAYLSPIKRTFIRSVVMLSHIFLDLQLEAFQDTKCCGIPVSTPALYSGRPGFK
jgi:hypothetical protein